MLGDLIGEFQGQDTGRRVISTGDGHVLVEVSFAGTGTYYGTAVNGFGTYESELRPDGTLRGEGQGVDMSADGGTLSWQGVGIGHFTEGGGTSWRGSLFFSSASPQFERLNDVVGLFEYEVSPDGKSTGKYYEWK
ncbi:hypothetical protein RMN57_22220 [Kitasatospora sp. CM 4170]|uniref:DUF1579 domain-containing protein n=1 Tax=Kitasatospora aburaviensis TaxID=67265 RepID=A0ABW1F069_9ACTN|nr:hypothetical protein [Kitasatospora sp. CM 4170]WNM47222.1 hypothetical protein RMN57_22220 [Kitasatospora sp. CM 4170]